MAMKTVLAAGIKTRDLGGSASTQEYTRAIIEALPPLEMPRVTATRNAPAGSAKLSSPLKSVVATAAQPAPVLVRSDSIDLAGLAKAPCPADAPVDDSRAAGFLLVPARRPDDQLLPR